MKAAREALKIKQNKLVVAMLPGSRQSEVKQHAELFVKTAQMISQQHANAVFLVPLITRETRHIFEIALYKNLGLNNLSHKSVADEQLQEHLDLQILFGHAHDAMEAADIVIVASGTATLEAALLKKPMVITYRMPKLSWWILKRMNYLPYVGLPNILAGKFLVPELLQDEATPEKLADATTRLLSDNHYVQEIKQEFTKIHVSLKQNSAEKAAKAILAYLS